jgi:type III secretion protein V
VNAAALSARRAELALVGLLAAILAMMVVPLPTQLIDLFIALNLGLGLVLVASALHVRDVASFAAFPTIVLLATLYRLALNVSSTRLILLQADAGRVIEAFGKFVVRGDYLVGAMVFAVLTVVQFLVIARGAERVAEVGARFSLDALPGKQLAIDAELRAGTLSPEAARQARRALERESQLYGAMDGAMKFVKGDAIAGIVITLVNFIGGVTIGVLSRKLSVTDSLATYGLLTIGDGLVTQIPALLCATAAGLVVTRVTSDDPEASLGADIGRQLFGDARVLFAAALLLALLAVTPGLPAWPFALSAAGCALLFVRARRQSGLAARSLGRASLRPEPLALELSPALAAELAPRDGLLALAGGQAELDSPALDAALRSAAGELERTLGLRLPAVHVRVAPALAGRSFRVAWRELAAAPEEAEPDAPAHIAASVLRAAHRHSEDLLGLDQVQDMLRALEREAPALVRLSMPRPVSPGLLAEVLRLLARERVSVRWLAEILETLAVELKTDTRPERLAERVRRALGRRISQSLAPAGTLHVLRLAPELDEALADALEREGDQEWLALAPDLARDITRAITDAHTRAPVPHALVTDPTVRRHVRALIAHAAPELSVVTAFELDAGLRLVPLPLVGP